MKCPKCNAWTMVLDTRTPSATKHVKRRRYECANLHRFATMEYVEGTTGPSSTTKKAASSTSTKPAAKRGPKPTT